MAKKNRASRPGLRTQPNNFFWGLIKTIGSSKVVAAETTIFRQNPYFITHAMIRQTHTQSTILQFFSRFTCHYVQYFDTYIVYEQRKRDVEPPSKSNDLGVFENLDFPPFFHCIHIE